MISRAILIPFFTGKFGGPYNIITDLSLKLEKLNIITKVFTSSYIAQKGKERTEFFQKINDNFLIYRFNSFLKFREYRVSFNLFPFLLKEAKYLDIIHSNAIRSFQEHIGYLTSLSKKKPFIITPHGAIRINWDYSDKIPKMVIDKTLGYIARKLLNPYYIAVAKNEIPVLKKYGIDDDHIYYIPNCVDTDIFKPINSDKLRKKYISDDSDLILYVGRIAKGKGLDILIKLFYLIEKKNQKTKLMIVGEDSGFLPTIKALIYKYNLTKKVIFPGFISKENLPKYYSLADLIIYPSRQEIFGLVLCEAGACGKVVISSDIMGPNEIIINGKTGYKTDFKNLEELSTLILNLLKDENHLKQLGKNAMLRIKQEFSLERAVKKHLELYKTILNLN